MASHTGGYTSFNCEVTAQLREGENLLVIKVNNTLTGDVTLEIEELKIRQSFPVKDSKARIALDASPDL